MSNYEYLYEREKGELGICLKNIELFTKYIEDYECLKSRLKNFSDQTTHEIMVPVAGTKLAFFPGYIHHTNELMMLIGENYFVEKSNKEAFEFIDRRIKLCNSKLEMLKNQKTMLENWLQATESVRNESEQLVDITETCTEEEFQKWRSEHRKLVKEARKENESAGDDIDINKILEKYEAEEEEMDNKKKPKPLEQPLKLEIVERAQLTAPSKPSQSSSSGRPISKFKAQKARK